MLTDEQKKLRRSGIGGSEVAALLGMHPWLRPIDVWRSKVEGYDVETTFDMERGTFLEDGVAKWYAHRTGATLKEIGTLRHPKHDRVIVTPDRIATVNGRDLDLSIKCPSGFGSRRSWGDDGTDFAPEYAILQLQYEMAVLRESHGIEDGVIAAPVDGNLRMYPIRAEPVVQAALIEAAEKFCRDFVDTKTPPDPDASENYSEWLRDRFPDAKVEAIPATVEMEQWVEAFEEARAARMDCERKELEAKNWLQAMMGPAERIDGNGWRVLWRNTKGKKEVDWEGAIDELGGPGFGEDERDELVARHTYKKEPQRRFTFTRIGGGQ